MSGPPPAKRLRQATLSESFSFSRKTSIASSSVGSNMEDNGKKPVEDEHVRASSDHETNDSTIVASEQHVDVEEPSTSHNSQGIYDSQESLPNSADLFSDYSQTTVDEDNAIDIDGASLEVGFVEEAFGQETASFSGESKTFGTPLSKLNRSPECCAPLPRMKATPSHVVLVKMPMKAGEIPKPYPDTYHDKWDAFNVKMPCSKQSLYPGVDKGQKVLQDRWELIQLALKAEIGTTHDLESSILAYNSRYSEKWNFNGLHSLFKKFEKEEIDAFFADTLPKMVNLALQVADICTKAIPLLKKRKNLAVTMSQAQVACLLANAFFCTFPRRNARGKQSEYSSFPDINFNQLFAGSNKAEKLKCILHYFRRVTTNMPEGTVTFQRQFISDERFPNWARSKTKLCKLHVSSAGTIEDDGAGMLQVDFANKFLGGGVLGHGCVQEEIRFLICPEMIISRLITEVLEDNECLLMTGCEQFSTYTGYADTFRWSANHKDETVRDEWGRRRVQVVAIDALMIHNYKEQFKPSLVKRELNKAYCGFYSHTQHEEPLPAIATGNWGCGAFGGESQLKALIQLMAASEAHRDVAYFTFNDSRLARELNEVYTFIEANELSVGDLWQRISQYYQDGCVNKGRPSRTLYTYILEGNKPGPGPSPDNKKDVRPPSPDWAADTP